VELHVRDDPTIPDKEEDDETDDNDDECADNADHYADDGI